MKLTIEVEWEPDYTMGTDPNEAMKHAHERVGTTAEWLARMSTRESGSACITKMEVRD